MRADWVDRVMEQAQVYASAWSLVGGRFDNGSGLDEANDAKADLRTLLAHAVQASVAERQRWMQLHAQAVGELRAAQGFIQRSGIGGGDEVLALTGGSWAAANEHPGAGAAADDRYVGNPFLDAHRGF